MQKLSDESCSSSRLGSIVAVLLAIGIFALAVALAENGRAKLSAWAETKGAPPSWQAFQANATGTSPLDAVAARMRALRSAATQDVQADKGRLAVMHSSFGVGTAADARLIPASFLGSLLDIDGEVFRSTLHELPLGTFGQADLARAFPDLIWSRASAGASIELVSVRGTPSGRALKMHYPGGPRSHDRGATLLLAHLPSRYQELYLSYWIRFGTDFDFAAAGTLPALGISLQTDPTATQPDDRRASTQFVGPGWRVIDARPELVVQSDPSSRAAEPPSAKRSSPLRAGRWYHLEQHLALDSREGGSQSIRIWLDGKLVIDSHAPTANDPASLGNQADNRIDQLRISARVEGKRTLPRQQRPSALYLADFEVRSESPQR